MGRRLPARVNTCFGVMMDIGDLLSRDAIVMRGGASSKRQALSMAAEAASSVLGLDQARILDALLEREALGSTGLGSGVAVPHARLEGLDRVVGVFVRLDAPVAFDAVDDQSGDAVTELDPLNRHAQIVPQGGDMDRQNVETLEGRTGIEPA